MTDPHAPPPPSSPVSASSAARAGLVIAALMCVLGLFVGGRVLLTDSPPLTGTRALDVAFAVFFVARGGLAYGRFRRARAAR
ncbi:MAG: hypothetical protein IT359_14235 [Gemmatimonadaceae bacterium]|nr:hypothetical protein [Gemmatimonadaceae bacterium]